MTQFIVLLIKQLYDNQSHATSIPVNMEEHVWMLETASNVFALKDIPDGRADKASKDTISALKITSS